MPRVLIDSLYANVVICVLICYVHGLAIMDYDVVSVPPMSLPALDALQSLPTDFTSALDTLQRQSIVDAFARVDFLTKGTIRLKLF